MSDKPEKSNKEKIIEISHGGSGLAIKHYLSKVDKGVITYTKALELMVIDIADLERGVGQSYMLERQAIAVTPTPDNVPKPEFVDVEIKNFMVSEPITNAVTRCGHGVDTTIQLCWKCHTRARKKIDAAKRVLE